MQNTPQTRAFLKELNIPRSKPEWLGEILAAAGLLATIIVVAVLYRSLPATIATHFGFSGTPNGWGSKSTLLLLLGLAAVVYLLLTVFANKPQYCNVAVRITEENAARQFRLVRAFLLLQKVIICWLFFYLTYATTQIALERMANVGVGIFVFLGLVVLSVVAMFILSYKLR